MSFVGFFESFYNFFVSAFSISDPNVNFLVLILLSCTVLGVIKIFISFLRG